MRLSTRNQFPGKVISITKGEAMAVVKVVVLVAAPAPIAPWTSAHITRARWLSSAVATLAPVGVTVASLASCPTSVVSGGRTIPV